MPPFLNGAMEDASYRLVMKVMQEAVASGISIV
jgi:hypothetical protein